MLDVPFRAVSRRNIERKSATLVGSNRPQAVIRETRKTPHSAEFSETLLIKDAYQRVHQTVAVDIRRWDEVLPDESDYPTIV
jgi:hypothetical protein